MTEFKSTHNLPFLAAPFKEGLLDTGIKLRLFKIGTCEGQWGDDPHNYYILSIINHKPGNGHLQDVFEWFQMSCKRDKKNLIILEVWNKKFKKHLLKKRGFVPFQNDDVINFYKYM